MQKRLLALFIALALCFSLLGVSAFASEEIVDTADSQSESTAEVAPDSDDSAVAEQDVSDPDEGLDDASALTAEGEELDGNDNDEDPDGNDNDEDPDGNDNDEDLDGNDDDGDPDDNDQEPEAIDTTALEAAIAAADAAIEDPANEQYGYALATWSAYVVAYNAAYDVIEDEDASQEDVDAAAAALESALAGLVEVVVLDWSSIDDAIAAAEELDASLYTEETLASVDTALEAAYAVLASLSVTQEDVDAAAAALNAAISSLVLIPTRDTLGSLTGQIEALIPDFGNAQFDYTDASWAAFIEAYNNAYDVLENEDPTAEEIADAQAALQAAYDALETVPVLDATVLQSWIEQAEALDASAYTAESYAIVQDALENAYAVLAGLDITQAAIDDAVLQLGLSINALEEITTEETGEEQDEETAEEGGLATGISTGVTSPQTGDSSHIALFVVLCVLCCGALAAVLITKKVKAQKD